MSHRHRVIKVFLISNWTKLTFFSRRFLELNRQPNQFNGMTLLLQGFRKNQKIKFPPNDIFRNGFLKMYWSVWNRLRVQVKINPNFPTRNSSHIMWCLLYYEKQGVKVLRFMIKTGKSIFNNHFLYISKTTWPPLNFNDIVFWQHTFFNNKHINLLELPIAKNSRVDFAAASVIILQNFCRFTKKSVKRKRN